MVNFLKFSDSSIKIVGKGLPPLPRFTSIFEARAFCKEFGLQVNKVISVKE